MVSAWCAGLLCLHAPSLDHILLPWNTRTLTGPHFAPLEHTHSLLHEAHTLKKWRHVPEVMAKMHTPDGANRL